MNEDLLRERIVSFVNSTLLSTNGVPVGAETPLFERGALDSLQVLDLIAFVESETGRPLADSAIRLTNFRTASAIAATVFHADGAVRPSRDRIWSRTRSRRTSSSALVPDLEREMSRWGQELGAREVLPEPAIAAAALARAGYLESFPRRAVFPRSAVDAAGGLAIPPAACLQCYAELADRTLDSAPLVLSVRNHCARGDEVVDADHGRLREFTMREIVIVGSANDVDRARRALMRRAQTYVARLDLSATIEVATDPFHIPADRGKLALQRLRALKYELRMPVRGQPVAVASFNYHEDFFGRAFGITLSDGSLAHTACVAFGLERWELALRDQLEETSGLARTA